MFNDPVIFCVPIKEFEPVLANELVCELVTKLEVCEFNVYGDNIEPVCAFNTKLLVCEFDTNDVVAAFGTYPKTYPLNEHVIPSVTNSEPVMTAEPENGNPAPAPAFNA
jgi:hypothetical protein